RGKSVELRVELAPDRLRPHRAACHAEDELPQGWQPFARKSLEIGEGKVQADLCEPLDGPQVPHALRPVPEQRHASGARQPFPFDEAANAPRNTWGKS